MALVLSALSDLSRLGFDDIIDVRSPAEYADDHLPGALNLPVLDDAERVRVGTLYKQVSPFTARKVGAALVAKNAAHHLQQALIDRPGQWRPLVYCWRGGMRSASFATILSQIGWRVERLEGGYKSWRRLVVRQLVDEPVASPVVLLDGNTGSAKTEVLNLLPAHGVQVIDLEHLAHHRGSLFGAMGRQPSQRLFESRLAQALARLDPARPVVVEAESATVGERHLPKRLWQAMQAAPRIVIEAPPHARAAYLARSYHDVAADTGRLRAAIEALRPYQSAERIAEWLAMADAGAFETLAHGLVTWHYDPRYSRHRRRIAGARTVVAATSLAPDTLPPLARAVAALVS